MRRQLLQYSLILSLISGLAGCAAHNWRQQLNSEDPIQRIDGAVAAGQAKDRAALGPLVDRLQDDDQAVRMCAIMALKRIEGTDLGYKYWAEPDRSGPHGPTMAGLHQNTYGSPSSQPQILANRRQQ